MKTILRILRRLLCPPHMAMLNDRELAEIRDLEERFSTPWQRIALVGCLVIDEEETEVSGFGYGDG